MFLPIASAASADVRLVTRRLVNGMTVVLAPEVSGETAAMHLTFDAGTHRDPAARHGTASLASRCVAARLPNFTADLNQERAVFTREVAAGNLVEAIKDAGHALHHITVSADDFVKARDELNRSIEQTTHGGVAAEELLLGLVYGIRPHGHGPMARPANVRRTDVQRFLRSNYDPAYGVLAIAGRFDANVVMRAIETVFGGLRSNGPRQRCAPYQIKLPAERLRHLDGLSTQQTEVHLGYPTAVPPSPDWYALNILADIIGQGSESRLQQRLVAGGSATAFGEGETESPCAASLLRMRARVAPNTSPAVVLSAVDDELERLARDLVSNAELQTAREQERRWAADQLSTPAGVAGAAARAALFYGEPERANTDVALMLAVSAEDVRRVARQYLRPSNRAVVIVRNSP